MISWMLYALVVGALVVLAARGIEQVCRLLGQPTRWAWAGALVLTVVLIASAPHRVPVASVVTVVSVVEAFNSLPLPITPAPAVAERITTAGRAALAALTTVPLEHVGAVVRRLSGRTWDQALLAAWIACSSLVLLAFLWTALHYRSIRGRLPVVRLRGTEVRLSERMGPSVMGLARPEIVVPRWLLNAPVENQRLILAHELEHRRARDPLLLMIGWVGIVLVPWNPAVWWMASRLRLAAEVDCDARVLRGGVEPLAYGSLLIAVAGHVSGVRLTAPGLADAPSHLERRLTAMTPETRRFAVARAGGVGALAAVILLAACEASLPTAAQVERMDVAAAEKAVSRAGLLGQDGSPAEYLVNGVMVTPEEARALPRDQIASISVARSKDVTQPTRVEIRTKDAPAGIARRPGKPGDYTSFGMAAGGAPDKPVLYESRRDDSAPAESRSNVTPGLKPLIFIDGVRADEAALQEINRTPRMKSVEIIKGPAALAVYGVEGAGGVIRVTTK